MWDACALLYACTLIINFVHMLEYFGIMHMCVLVYMHVYLIIIFCWTWLWLDITYIWVYMQLCRCMTVIINVLFVHLRALCTVIILFLFARYTLQWDTRTSGSIHTLHRTFFKVEVSDNDSFLEITQFKHYSLDQQ